MSTLQTCHIQLKSPVLQKIMMTDSTPHTITLTTPVGSSVKLTIDTTANWNTKVTYVPKKGEIIVYSDRHVIDDVAYPGVKIGDGLAYVVDLPFVGDDMIQSVLDLLDDHVKDMNVHVRPGERTEWNSKIGCDINGEILILKGLNVNG